MSPSYAGDETGLWLDAQRPENHGKPYPSEPDGGPESGRYQSNGGTRVCCGLIFPDTSKAC